MVMIITNWRNDTIRLKNFRTSSCIEAVLQRKKSQQILHQKIEMGIESYRIFLLRYMFLNVELHVGETTESIE